MHSYRLSLDLRLQAGGLAVRNEPVTPADLADARAELLFNAGARRGRPGLRLEDLKIRLLPLFAREDEPFCTGYALTGKTDGGPATTCTFSLAGLGHVARRGARKLLQEGRIRQADPFYHSLRADPFDEELIAPDARSQQPAQVTCPELEYQVLRLAPLIEQARLHGPEPDPGCYPVFFTEEALARTERFARAGASQDPVVETGCLLIGTLASCPDSLEMFAIISDALEASDSTQRSFSLTYTGATWERIQAVLRARRAQPGMRTQRILGQAHSHPFLPLRAGESTCEACQSRDVCDRSSAFLSQEDLDWCRAIFSEEPWQLSHVFGLNARGENVDSFYGQRMGTLMERSYYVLTEIPVA